MTVLRLAMRHGPRGVTRICAQFPAEHVREIASLAARLAALSIGPAEWSIQTETGRKVEVEPPPPADGDEELTRLNDKLERIGAILAED